MESGAWIAAAVVLGIAPVLLGPLGTFTLTEMAIQALFASSLNLLTGYTRMVSFGHAAFFGLGAYATGVALQKIPGMTVPAAILTAMLVAAAVSAVVGYFCVRRDTIYFAMLTLAFSQIVQVLIIRMPKLTGGEQGLTGSIPRPPISLGFFSLNPEDPIQFYYLCMAATFVCLLVMRIILASPFGYSLRAIAANPDRASLSGINVKRQQLLVFIMAAAFAGVAGAFHGLFQLSVFPELLHWTTSAQVVVMVLLGGIGRFLGPAVGAVALVLMQTYSGELTRHKEMLLGLLLLGIVLGLKGGVLGGLAGAGRRIAGQFTGARKGTAAEAGAEASSR